MTNTDNLKATLMSSGLNLNKSKAFKNMLKMMALVTYKGLKKKPKKRVPSAFRT